MPAFSHAPMSRASNTSYKDDVAALADFGSNAQAQEALKAAAPTSAPSPAAAPAPALAAAGGPAAPAHGSSHGVGWIDKMFGLNPDKTFAQSAGDGLGYGPGGAFSPKEGDGNGMTLLRGLGAVVCSPLLLGGVLGGHMLDEFNHGPSILHGMFDSHE